MCNRYIPPEQATIERFWHIGRHKNQLLPWPTEMFPRAQGPFIRANHNGELELVVGQWGLIPHFAKSPKLKYSTNNARFEELADKASYRDPWKKCQRCIIPAVSFDEPCWETGRNVWWRFRRADANPWGLAGIWNTWIDRGSGEVFESYTMLTINADGHALMNRMHKPYHAYGPNDQDKRSVIPIEVDQTEQWLHGNLEDAYELMALPDDPLIKADPVTQ